MIYPITQSFRPAEPRVICVARLVVDSGIHAKTWTRERAVPHMMSTAALQRGDGEGDIDRNFVRRTQPFGYEIGEFENLKLRGRGEQRLGAKVDNCDFHAMAIEHWSLPLPVLERLIDEWIASGSGRPEALRFSVVEHT